MSYTSVIKHISVDGYLFSQGSKRDKRISNEIMELIIKMTRTKK